MDRESSLNYLKSNISFICVLISAIFTAYFLSSLVINYAKKCFVHPVSVKSYIKSNVQNQINESDLSEKYIKDISDIMRYSTALENNSISNNESEVSTIENNNGEETTNINISDIVVTAIILGESYSLAVFKTNSTEDVIISEGEKIGKYTLKEVMKDKVILVDPKGKIFEKQLLFGAEIEPNEKEDKSAVSSSKTEVSLSKREFLSLFEPPDKLMRDLILSPYSKNNIPYGIRITTINPESLMASKIGLQAGDILLKINNRVLSSPEEAMAAYSTIKNESEIVFNIERNGRIFDLKVTLI